MEAIDIIEVSDVEVVIILDTVEGHFSDVKAKMISPASLTKTLSALANAEGGEVYIGIHEINKQEGIRIWDGFKNPEEANGFIQAFEELFPLGQEHQYTFLHSANYDGYVLKIDIKKSIDIKKASNGNIYLRRGAQNLPVDTNEKIDRLRRNKGISSFETETVNASKELVTDSNQVYEFMVEVVPTIEPEPWLKKQQILINEKPTVAGLLLFADEPQSVLPKRCGLKIYRYKTKDNQGSRENLAFDPISIEGSAYKQIYEAVAKTAEIIESVRVNTPAGLELVTYPDNALHEIITNAVIHRDYNIADDIHIRIFDNRVEVVSPGTLPGHITPDNILDERFSRNGVIVRLINKFPNAPNKDVGEGLNTAFEAMRAMKLKPPQIHPEGSYVKIILKHEPLASPEEVVLEYLQSHDQITNKQARELCFIGSENRMKVVLQRMIRNELIKLVPGTTRYTAAYTLNRQVVDTN